MTKQEWETDMQHDAKNGGHLAVEDNIQRLLEKAMQSGASDARVIATPDIMVRNEFASLCEHPHKCPNYGLSLSCPPHVGGPEGFEKLFAKSKHSIVIKIEVPVEVLFSDQRREVYQLLHEIVAAVEQEAIQMGFRDSKAFAGGSCKQIFCHAHEFCRVISAQGGCRHPESARPSMSGCGVDVVRMMQSAGYQVNTPAAQKPSKNDAMSWIAGLVLLM